MCWKCGKQNNVNGIISRSSVCEECGSDIRCCKNCRFYSLGSHFDCHETIEELVTDKERANFCDNFSYTNISAGKKSSDIDASSKKIFDSLFGD